MTLSAISNTLGAWGSAAHSGVTGSISSFNASAAANLGPYVGHAIVVGAIALTCYVANRCFKSNNCLMKALGVALAAGAGVATAGGVSLAAAAVGLSFTVGSCLAVSSAIVVVALTLLCGNSQPRQDGPHKKHVV
jgi:hypothetical protein